MRPSARTTGRVLDGFDILTENSGIIESVDCPKEKEPRSFHGSVGSIDSTHTLFDHIEASRKSMVDTGEYQELSIRSKRLGRALATLIKSIETIDSSGDGND